MKIEALAGLLGKPVDELATALSVENLEDALPDEVVQKSLKDHINKIRSEAKAEGKGWGLREIQKALEKTGAEGSDINEMIADLAGKANKPPETKPDEKLVKKLEVAEARLLEFQSKLEGIEKQKAAETRNSVIKAKVAALKKEFAATDKAFDLALEALISSRQFEIDGEDVYVLKADGKTYEPKPFEDIAKTHFSELFEVVKPGGDPPRNPQRPDPRPAPKPEDRNELIMKSRNAATPEERSAALEQLAALTPAE
jgi:hypothetical protein